jgi:hypothetical protein
MSTRQRVLISKMTLRKKLTSAWLTCWTEQTPDYKRKLAVYQAMDNPTGAGDGKHALAGIGTRCSFFKLDKTDIQGLRQCFSDPDVRIRQDFQFTETVYPRIKKMKVTGGVLEGPGGHLSRRPD